MRDENKRTAHLCAARDPSNLAKCLFPVEVLIHLALFWCIPDGGSQQMVGNARAVKRSDEGFGLGQELGLGTHPTTGPGRTVTRGPKIGL